MSRYRRWYKCTRLNIIGNYRNREFFPIDNSILKNDSEDMVLIRHFLVNYFVTRFENVALPIQPKWLLFGIVLQARYDCEIISINICLDIGEELKITEVEVKVCLWYLHYCIGTIIYYPDLPDKWFEENVICSPQVVFNSIEKLILEPLCSGRLLFKKDRNNWAYKGQFSISSLLKCCKVEFPEVEEELKKTIG